MARGNSKQDRRVTVSLSNNRNAKQNGGGGGGERKEKQLLEQLVLQNKNNEKRIKMLEKQLKQSQSVQQSQVVLQPMMDQESPPSGVDENRITRNNNPKITKTSNGVTIGRGTNINMIHSSTPEARTRLIDFLSGELAHCVLQVMTNHNNFDDRGISQGHILFVKWNNTGLDQRVPVASVIGVKNSDDLIISRPNTNSDLAVAVIECLQSGPRGGKDIRSLNQVFYFKSRADALFTLENTLKNNLWLRRRGAGWTNDVSAELRPHEWCDVIDCLQLVAVKTNVKAVGPEELQMYFNF